MLHRLPTKWRTPVGIMAWLLIAVAVGLAVASFVARSYVVFGPSMEPALRPGDHILVNKLGRSVSWLTGHSYVPKRGELVVFRNPFYSQGNPDEFVVKRVIGLPGDRVEVHGGRITISPTKTPTPFSFNPDSGITGPQQPTSGTVDRIVPDDELFMVGDNRLGQNSLDSRNGMSTIPVRQLEGNVVVRLWPVTKWRWF